MSLGPYSLKQSIWAFLLCLGSVTFTACSAPETADSRIIKETQGWDAAKLYTTARELYNNRDYEQSVRYLEVLESRYPFGRYAQQAQMDMAYAYFKDNNPKAAMAATDRFIKMHPDHPRLDYIYYLRGLIHFKDDLGILGRLTTQDISERDPQAAKIAFDNFSIVVSRFPNSMYAADSTLRLQYLINALAAHEVNIAQYYYKRGAYLAAANRAQEAIKRYQKAPVNEEALDVMIRSYKELGLTDLMEDAKRVLQATYPNSKYLKN